MVFLIYFRLHSLARPRTATPMFQQARVYLYSYKIGLIQMVKVKEKPGVKLLNSRDDGGGIKRQVAMTTTCWSRWPPYITRRAQPRSATLAELHTRVVLRGTNTTALVGLRLARQNEIATSCAVSPKALSRMMCGWIGSPIGAGLVAASRQDM